MELQANFTFLLVTILTTFSVTASPLLRKRIGPLVFAMVGGAGNVLGTELQAMHQLDELLQDLSTRSKKSIGPGKLRPSIKPSGETFGEWCGLRPLVKISEEEEGAAFSHAWNGMTSPVVPDHGDPPLKTWEECISKGLKDTSHFTDSGVVNAATLPGPDAPKKPIVVTTSEVPTLKAEATSKDLADWAKKYPGYWVPGYEGSPYKAHMLQAHPDFLKIDAVTDIQQQHSDGLRNFASLRGAAGPEAAGKPVSKAIAADIKNGWDAVTNAASATVASAKNHVGDLLSSLF
ncbi:hypothetical protein FRB95_004044 [Tulasnella sp. JGI-2019a]|nr:hypothetical protein FRB95_004044 [Tulasnella sp. JGI-2019a]